MHRIERYWKKMYTKPSDRSIRWFGILLSVFLVLVFYFLPKSTNEWFLIPALLPLTGLLFLPALRICYALSMLLTRPVGWLVSLVVLGIIFLIVLTPMSLIRKRSFPSGWVKSVPQTDPAKMHE